MRMVAIHRPFARLLILSNCIHLSRIRTCKHGKLLSSTRLLRHVHSFLPLSILVYRRRRLRKPDVRRWLTKIMRRMHGMCERRSEASVLNGEGRHALRADRRRHVDQLRWRHWKRRHHSTRTSSAMWWRHMGAVRGTPMFMP